MKMTGKFVLLGLEPKTSAKTGKSYVQGLFQSGTETLQCIVTADTTILEVKQYQECILELDYNSRYQNMSVTAIKKAV